MAQLQGRDVNQAYGADEPGTVTGGTFPLAAGAPSQPSQTAGAASTTTAAPAGYGGAQQERALGGTEAAEDKPKVGLLAKLKAKVTHSDPHAQQHNEGLAGEEEEEEEDEYDDADAAGERKPKKKGLLGKVKAKVAAGSNKTRVERSLGASSSSSSDDNSTGKGRFSDSPAAAVHGGLTPSQEARGAALPAGAGAGADTLPSDQDLLNRLTERDLQAEPLKPMAAGSVAILKRDTPDATTGPTKPLTTRAAETASAGSQYVADAAAAGAGSVASGAQHLNTRVLGDEQKPFTERAKEGLAAGVQYAAQTAAAAAGTVVGGIQHLDTRVLGDEQRPASARVGEAAASGGQYAADSLAAGSGAAAAGVDHVTRKFQEGAVSAGEGGQALGEEAEREAKQPQQTRAFGAGDDSSLGLSDDSVRTGGPTLREKVSRVRHPGLAFRRAQ
eukprot:jgi/Mesen1/6741/ME000344S06026